MKRSLFGSFWLSIAIGLTCQPTQAGDQKSMGAAQGTARAMLAAPAIDAPAIQAAMQRSPATGLFETEDLVGQRAGSDSERRGEAKQEHKVLTLFHINSKFGGVAVQPVIGKVNGAQFSIGF
jgi:hypothetical protein